MVPLSPVQNNSVHIRNSPPADLPQSQAIYKSSISSSKNSSELLKEIDQQILRYDTPSPIENSQSAPKTNEEWKKTTREQLDCLISKASMLITIRNMDEDINYSLMMQIINEASKNKSKTLYEIFYEKHGVKLSWPKRVYARWNYFLFYKCGLIPCTLDTFMNEFVEKIRLTLIQKNDGKNLTLFVNNILTSISSFLEVYLDTVKKFAQGVDIQSCLEKYIIDELDKKQKTPLIEICEQFTEISIREFIPRVNFFKSLSNNNNIFLKNLGWLLDNTIGSFFNRFILHQAIRKYIPTTLKSAIESTLKFASPTNLPFVVSVTDAISEQLDKFKIKINAKNAITSIEKPSLLVMGKLPEIVTNLIDALQLEHFNTASKLKAYLNPPQGAMNQLIDLGDRVIHLKLGDSYFRKKIEEGTIEGCRTALAYLLDPDNSEETFCRLLQLLNQTFDSSSLTDDKILKNHLDETTITIADKACDLFKDIIHQSVSENIVGYSPAQIEQIKLIFQKKQQEKIADLVSSDKDKRSSSLVIDLQTMEKNISSYLANKDFDISSIFEQLNAMLSKIDRYHASVRYIEKEILQSSSVSSSSLQKVNDRATSPILMKIRNMLDQITTIKYQLNQIMFYSFFNKKLDEMNTQKIESIDSLRDELLTASKKYDQRSVFTQCINSILTEYQELQIESQILKSLLSLQDLSSKDNMKPFSWNTFKQLIPDLEKLTNDEENSLSVLINNPNFNTQLQALIDSHREKQDHLKQEVDQFITTYSNTCRSRIEASKQELQHCKKEISTLTEDLQKSSEELIKSNFNYRSLRELLFSPVSSTWKHSKTIVAEHMLVSPVLLPKLMNIFQNLNTFIMKSYIWKWVATNSIKCLNETFEPIAPSSVSGK